MPTPQTSEEKKNAADPPTPASHVNMDKPQPIRKHGTKKYETDSEGRTTRTLSQDEQWGRA